MRKIRFRVPKIKVYTIFSDKLGFFSQFVPVIKKIFLTANIQSILGVMIFCFLTFFVSIGVVATTRNGKAEYTPEAGQVLGVSDETAIAGPALPVKPFSLEDFANTTISKLHDYMEAPATETQLLVKKDLVKKYLEYKNSPFAKDDAALDTLVRTPHMKIMLEIAFAESSMGKRCVDNNCSNIGSAPDRPYWHQYKSLSNWILDFNRLLERRYKDKTLTEMCGVYVQPCTNTWLAATGQISQELEEWGIE